LRRSSKRKQACRKSAKQVASVFVNRLNQGMRLQTDPTVIYGITNGQGILGRGLRRSELRKETPFNTYVIDALPPTPIANPGRARPDGRRTTGQRRLCILCCRWHGRSRLCPRHWKSITPMWARWRKIEAERGAEAAGNASTAGN